jgi:hypothetical protein
MDVVSGIDRSRNFRNKTGSWADRTHLPQSSVEVINDWIYTSIPLCLIACTETNKTLPTAENVKNIGVNDVSIRVGILYDINADCS